MKRWHQLIWVLALSALHAWGYAPDRIGGFALPNVYRPDGGRQLSFDPVWNLSDLTGYSFCAGDPVNAFDADGRYGKAALNWATGIDPDCGVPLSEQIQAYRQGWAEYLWTTVPAFDDAVVGSVIAALFTPQDFSVIEQRVMGANTPEVQAYDRLAQMAHERVGSPLAAAGVYDPASADAQWGRDLGELALFVSLLEGARGQINRRPALADGLAAETQIVLNKGEIINRVWVPIGLRGLRTQGHLEVVIRRAAPCQPMQPLQ